VTKGQGANMLKIGVKRRRTKAQIAEDKEEEVLKLSEQQEAIAELASLRRRVQEAEHAAANNVGAAKLMSHMINAGAVKQDGEEEIIVNAVGGVQRFGINEGLKEILYDNQENNDQLAEEQANQD